MDEVLDPEVLDGDQGKLSREGRRHLVQEVLALGGGVFLLVRDDPALLSPAGRAEGAAREDPLSLRQLGLGRTVPPWVVDQVPVRRGEQGMKPHIESDRGTGMDRCLGVGHLDLEAHRPSAASIVLYRGHLDAGLRGERAMPFDLDASGNAGQMESIFSETHAIPEDAGDRRKRMLPFEPGIARLPVPGFHPAEEGPERVVDSTEHLDGRRMAELGQRIPRRANGFELGALGNEVDGEPAAFPGLAPFLEGGVVQGAARPEQLVQATTLRACWIKAVFVAPVHGSQYTIRPYGDKARVRSWDARPSSPA